MKLSTKGIGWLIAGGIICLSATESYGFRSTLSTIALGMVFILIYVMKQIFDPRGIGWFIPGGVLLAFLVEEGFTEEGLTTLVISTACLVVFYLKNREELQAIMNGERIVYDDEYDEYYEEDEAYADEEDYDESVQDEGPYDGQGAAYADEEYANQENEAYTEAYSEVYPGNDAPNGEPADYDAESHAAGQPDNSAETGQDVVFEIDQTTTNQ